MEWSVSREKTSDSEEIDALIYQAFGPGRQERNVYRFRKNHPPIAELGFVARTEMRMVASIRFWPVRMPGGAIYPLLGPLAVKPDLRGIGLGRALVEKGLAEVKIRKDKAVLIIGDPGYYAPFGFSVDPVRYLNMGGPLVPLTLMGIEFTQGALCEEQGEITPVSGSSAIV